jgi:putative phosphoesterase
VLIRRPGPLIQTAGESGGGPLPAEPAMNQPADGGRQTMRIGLISDTHLPQRSRVMPESLRDIFRDADLIVHAGDVGDLSVIRWLEEIAPVEAVHGNDDSDEAIATLPFSLTLELGSHRLLLIHGHDRDWSVELALRREESWPAKLAYWHDLGRAAGAGIVVYGHTHVPIHAEVAGMHSINPGSLGSGSFFHRQTVRTVALLELFADGLSVTFVDVDRPGRPVPVVDTEATFSEGIELYHRPMYDQPVLSQRGWIRETLYPLAPNAVIHTVDSLADECWHGGRPHVSSADFIAALLTHPQATDELRSAVRSNAALASFVPD